MIFRTLYRICQTDLRAHFYTPFGVPCGHSLPLPLGEVAERSEDGEGNSVYCMSIPCLSLWERWPSAARTERVTWCTV